MYTHYVCIYLDHTYRLVLRNLAYDICHCYMLQTIGNAIMTMIHFILLNKPVEKLNWYLLHMVNITPTLTRRKMKLKLIIREFLVILRGRHLYAN